MIKLGIVGTGGIANWHAKNFQPMHGVEIVACADLVKERAEDYAERFGVNAAYGDYEEMFDKEDLDAVSVTTTDSGHCPVSLAALKKNLHVFCEKPLADNLKDAKRMAAAAKRKKGLITGVNFSYRNNDGTQKAARMIASGKIGRVMHVEGSYLQAWLASQHWGDWRTMPKWLWRLSTAHGSMGCLGDVGVHLFDLAGFVVGDIVEVDCLMKTFDKGKKKIGEYTLDANDGFAANVAFRNGAIGTLHSSRWASGHVNTVALRVFGDKGALDLNLDRGENPLMGCLGKDFDKVQWKPVRLAKKPSTFQRFITAIRTGKQCQTSFEGGARVQAYLDACMRSNEDRKPVKIK
ncbi:MAG: Gfo/Idh/MocA family protein [Candidatus Sumerlaeota bacterium]